MTGPLGKGPLPALPSVVAGSSLRLPVRKLGEGDADGQSAYLSSGDSVVAISLPLSTPVK